MIKQLSDYYGQGTTSVSRYICLLGLIICGFFCSCSDSDSDERIFPPRPVPARLVNDLADVISDEVEQELEQVLQSFANEHGPQIVVLTVSDLGGYDKAQYTYEIGQRWGVGDKNDNNGAIILIKPKTEETKGNAFIATGYGLEGDLPDITCANIVDEIMIPHFKLNDYNSGARAGAQAVMRCALGQSYREPVDNSVANISEEAYEEDEELDIYTIIGIIIILGISFAILIFMQWGVTLILNLILSLFGIKSSKSSDSSSSSGFWSDFSSSSGSFDFGGGSFGGGGGGGDW